jgi:hypothetical protein
LIDPTAIPQKQGTITLVDVKAGGFDGVCCDPCVLPKKDMAVSASGSYSLVFKYDKSRSTAFPWAGENPIPCVFSFSPFKQTCPYPFYPKNYDFNDPSTWAGLVEGATYNYHVYMDCGGTYWAWIQPGGNDYTLRAWETFDFLTNVANNFPPYSFNQTDYTCDPFHFVNNRGSGGVGIYKFQKRTITVDEIEP